MVILYTFIIEIQNFKNFEVCDLNLEVIIRRTILTMKKGEG